MWPLSPTSEGGNFAPSPPTWVFDLRRLCGHIKLCQPVPPQIGFNMFKWAAFVYVGNPFSRRSNRSSGRKPSSLNSIRLERQVGALAPRAGPYLFLLQVGDRAERAIAKNPAPTPRMTNAGLSKFRHWLNVTRNTTLAGSKHYFCISRRPIESRPSWQSQIGRG